MTEEIAPSEEAQAPVEDTNVESAPVEEVAEVVEAAPQPDLSSQFAEIRRRERAVRAEQNKAKQAQEAAKQEWLNELKADIKSQKFDKYGLSASDLTDAVLGAPEAPSTEEDQLKQDLLDLKAWRAEQVQRAQEEEQSRLQESNKQAVESYQKEVFSELEKEADNYELLLNDRNGKDLYWQSIVDFYQLEGKAPTQGELKEIAVQVESALFEQGKKLLSLSKFAPKVPVETPKEAPKPPESKSATISNSMTAQSGLKTKLVDSNNFSSKSPFSRFMEEKEQAMLKKLKNL